MSRGQLARVTRLQAHRAECERLGEEILALHQVLLDELDETGQALANEAFSALIDAHLQRVDGLELARAERAFDATIDRVRADHARKEPA